MANKKPKTVNKIENPSYEVRKGNRIRKGQTVRDFGLFGNCKFYGTYSSACSAEQIN